MRAAMSKNRIGSVSRSISETASRHAIARAAETIELREQLAQCLNRGSALERHDLLAIGKAEFPAGRRLRSRAAVDSGAFPCTVSFADLGDGKPRDDPLGRSFHDALAHLADEPSKAADADAGDGAAGHYRA